MLTRWIGVVGVAFVVWSGLCLAQPPAGGPERGHRPQDDRELGRPRLPGGWSQMLERMAKELNLDEAQLAKAETILKAQEEKSQAIYKDFVPTPEEQQKLEGLRQARREARRAGSAEEEARVAEEMRKVQEARQARLAPMQEKLVAIEKEEHDGLLAVMRDDQKEKFEIFWADWTISRRPAGPVRSPQALKAMTDKLADLTADQKKQIEEAFAGFKKAVREDAKEDSPEYRRRTRQLYEDVIKALTPEQREKISAQLREGRPDRGGRRGFPGGRGERGPATQPARPGGEKPDDPS
jgi:hypothetical protein